MPPDAEPAAPVTEDIAPSRTDRRRVRTRNRLVQATRALISEKGVAALRITEITERADVGLGTFYNYFSTKEELVDLVLQESLGALTDTLSEPVDVTQDVAELVSDAIRRFVSLAFEDPDFARLVVHLNHADALFATSVYPAARRAVDLGLTNGRFQMADPTVAVIAIVGGAMAVMRAILDGRAGHGAEARCAEGALRELGVPFDQAAAIARRPLE